jgi:hypothetical protein
MEPRLPGLGLEPDLRPLRPGRAFRNSTWPERPKIRLQPEAGETRFHFGAIRSATVSAMFVDPSQLPELILTTAIRLVSAVSIATIVIKIRLQPEAGETRFHFGAIRSATRLGTFWAREATSPKPVSLVVLLLLRSEQGKAVSAMFVDPSQLPELILTSPGRASAGAPSRSGRPRPACARP